MDKKNRVGWKVIKRARIKSNQNLDKVPINDPSHNEDLNAPFSDPIQISPEKRFNYLLHFLNDYSFEDFYPQKKFALQALSTCLPLLASPEQRKYFLRILKPIAIKIMESGIFDKGGLKGKNIISHNPIIYDFHHPIENIDQFIFGLASVLYRHEMGKEYPTAFQWFAYAEAGRILKLFISGVEIWKGKRAAQPLKKLLRELNGNELMRILIDTAGNRNGDLPLRSAKKWLKIPEPPPARAL